MATKVFMEALSPTMEEGRLVKWLKNEGDQIASGDTLAEVETDKAIMELVARGDGVLRKRLLERGRHLAGGPGDRRHRRRGRGHRGDRRRGRERDRRQRRRGADRGPPPVGQDAAAPADPASRSTADTIAATRETPAASPEPQTPRQSRGEASVPPQEKEAGLPPGGPRPQDAVSGQGAGGDRSGRAPATAVISARRRSPAASPANAASTSPRFTAPGPAAASSAATSRAPPARRRRQRQRPRAHAPPPHRRARATTPTSPLTQMRKTIARRLGESIGPIPTFYLTAEFDMERVAEMRTAMAELGAEYKVSVNDIVLKAVATALAAHPEVNAHWMGDRIRQHHRVHLGMAVAIEEGLITPVIFDADRKRMSEISAEARELAKRARERKLKPEEFTGSTFSVSNLGMFGIDQFTAIINPPEAAILAVGAVEEKPVVVDGQVTVPPPHARDHELRSPRDRRRHGREVPADAAADDREPADAGVLRGAVRDARCVMR